LNIFHITYSLQNLPSSGTYLSHAIMDAVHRGH